MAELRNKRSYRNLSGKPPDLMASELRTWYLCGTCAQGFTDYLFKVNPQSPRGSTALIHISTIIFGEYRVQLIRFLNIIHPERKSYKAQLSSRKLRPELSGCYPSGSDAYLRRRMEPTWSSHSSSSDCPRRGVDLRRRRLRRTVRSVGHR